MESFKPLQIQEEIKSFWKEEDMYANVKKRLAGKKKYYFMDGPPYTSGHVHLGTAWNKCLKDMFLRIKRMQGYDVWDRAGYDMHGLPIEHATEKELGIKGAEQIKEYGVERFVEECRKLAIKHMLSMNEVFEDLGVWMDFENAYQTLSKTFMDGEWRFIKAVHEKGRLYEGLRTTMWDATDATAVAKHETEYKEVEDKAIFVRLPFAGVEDEYLLVWTTTPWTIPFNLAVMVNPELDYVKVGGSDGASYWVAEELLESVRSKIDTISDDVQRTCKGVELEGLQYVHPFAEDMGFAELKKQHEKLHTILLSKEYVDTSAGSGLVHCAPGCGPEDFEVGYRNGLPAFNTVGVHGVFEKAGRFTDMRAKLDDDRFIELFEEQGCLMDQHSYVHDYPHAQRSKQPVIFRTTKQWFIKVDDIKKQLIAENDEITWLPKAGYNAFNSWLTNLRDNSISKQRFWGTPIPIWRNVDDPEDWFVVGSAGELEEYAGKKLDDLHRVDDIEIVRDAKTYRRIPDVFDVWVDAGTVLWNCLRNSPDDPIEYVPADFITEGKDQIRGWFNLLHICGNVLFDKKAFKACYMHGYINDKGGRKMSKSEKNYIKPAEVTEKYGVDTFRFYSIGGTGPGLDLNYNFEDVELRMRNLNVLWNTQKYALAMGLESDEIPSPGIEERYILSRLHSMIKAVNLCVDGHRLNEIPGLIENFFLELSRTYIQAVREKDDIQTVYGTLMHCLKQVVCLMAPITPFTAEKLYGELRDAGIVSLQSVHMEAWPSAETEHIDEELERSFQRTGEVITAGLAARDQAQLGVRWPSQRIILDIDEETKKSLEGLEELIRSQLNVKAIEYTVIPVQYEVKPNYRAIGKSFGQETADVLTMLKSNEREVADHLNNEEGEFSVGGFDLTSEMFDVEAKPEEGATVILFEYGKLRLDTELTAELEAEGFAREVTRRLQNLRKTAGLEKSDVIVAELKLGDLPDISAHLDAIKETCGVEKLDVVDKLTLPQTSEEKVKGKSFALALRKQ